MSLNLDDIAGLDFPQLLEKFAAMAKEPMAGQEPSKLDARRLEVGGALMRIAATADGAVMTDWLAKAFGVYPAFISAGRTVEEIALTAAYHDGMKFVAASMGKLIAAAKADQDAKAKTQKKGKRT